MSLQSRFEKLDSKRQGLLTIAEKCSKLTLRHIFPPSDKDNNSPLGEPWQSVGSRGVNNLASKLLLTFLPSDGGFFRYSLDSAVKETLDSETLRNIEAILAVSEEITLQSLNQMKIRHVLFKAFKHLIITGNGALWFDEKKHQLKFYSLRDYVVVRDKAKNLVEVVLKESIDIDALPQAIRDFVLKKRLVSKQQQTQQPLSDDTSTNITLDSDNPSVTIYTGAKLTNGKWEMWQEIEELEVEGSRHTRAKLPIFILRWTDDTYGRGLVEQVLGDLKTLESLTKSLTENSAIAAQTYFLVNPTGMTKISKLRRAKNGDFVEGNANDVNTLRVDKYADLQVALERVAVLEDRLNQIFLIFHPRHAERVTAEEIRRLTEELEALLGGVYTLLAEELQKPLLETVFDSLQKQGKIPAMPREDIDIIITTGFEALSRTTMLNKMLMLLNAVGQIPNAVNYINWDEYLARILSSLNINPKGLVKSQQQLMQEQQQTQEQQMATQVAAQQVLQQSQQGTQGLQ